MGETLVVRRPLGLSGLTISRVALGCGNFGGVGSAPAFFGQGLTQDQAFELMDAAWEYGLTHFAPAAADGGVRSETAIGRWIASRGVRPQLTTKTYNPMRTGADHGLEPERIARQLHASLDRLRPRAPRGPRPARGRPRRAVPGARGRPGRAAARDPRRVRGGSGRRRHRRL